MILNQQTLRFAVLLAALPLAGAGCSGINASKSVAPIDFLMPGVFGAIPASVPAPAPALPTLGQASVQTLVQAK